MTRTHWRCVLIGGCLSALGLSTGCGGGSDFEIKVSRPAAERPDVTSNDAIVAKGTLRLPADQPFNMASHSSGQTGGGTGQSETKDTGSARASAKVEGTGSAFGEFQLGYCFDNTGAAPLAAVIRLKTKCSHKLELSGAERAQAVSALTFFVKDSNGTTLHSEPLIHGEAQTRPHQWSGNEETVIETRFEPGMGYYIVIAGRASVDATMPQTVNADLELSNCEVTIEWRPAPAAAQSTDTTAPNVAAVSHAAPDATTPTHP